MSAFACPMGCLWELPEAEAWTPFCAPGCDGWGLHPERVQITSVPCPTHRYHCRRVT